jgi:NADPH:quinone reductase-like Zn-dependent oxidoreductase
MTTEDPPNRGDVPRRAAAGFTTLPHVFQVLVLGSWVSRTGRKKIGHMEMAKPNQKDLVCVKELLEEGRVIPVIERRDTLREVPEALRYLEAGHAKGKVVITMQQNDHTSWSIPT